MTEIKILLDEQDFAQLVRGGVVQKPGSLITIALTDIGWERMYFQIERAMRDSGRPLDEHL